MSPIAAYFCDEVLAQPSDAKKTALSDGAGLASAAVAAAVPAGAAGAGDAVGATAGIKSSDTAAAIAVVTAGRFPNPDKRDTELLSVPEVRWERRSPTADDGQRCRSSDADHDQGRRRPSGGSSTRSSSAPSPFRRVCSSTSLRCRPGRHHLHTRREVPYAARLAQAPTCRVASVPSWSCAVRAAPLPVRAASTARLDERCRMPLGFSSARPSSLRARAPVLPHQSGVAVRRAAPLPSRAQHQLHALDVRCPTPFESFSPGGRACRQGSR